ncbi:putative AAA ATPase [Candidatus Sulfopaludibacter sp. SbA4]|nr:putative AAA ATPase [Candidatus Sulfopaludibacter sp. SbA4]
MIRRVTIRGFKRFGEVEFNLPGHVVLAGPNNTGKTTFLQAISAWSLALERWKQLNDYQRHGGSYTRSPIARQAFSAVPLGSFDLLWRERRFQGLIEIQIQSADDWAITMELIANSTEQIYVRPKPDVAPDILRHALLETVFVPAMTGLTTEEPVYQKPKLDLLMGQARPGEVLRNLLVEANQLEDAWNRLQQSIQTLFGYTLLPPDATGAHIVSEYREREGGPRLDIASAGSGFQQVLMLLTFLHTRPGAVLLLDEPDAHLHMILQDAIYGELRSVALRQRSQLVIATHSEVIINTVEPRELCALLDQPRMLSDSQERTRLIQSLGVLTNADILQSLEVPGILYLENYTDLDILRAWAKALQHPIADFLATRVFWKPTVVETRMGAAGIKARDHYEALLLVRENLPALELVDGDAHEGIQSTPITGRGFQRLRWRRYEIESYLVHPDALARFVQTQVGTEAGPYLEDLRRHFAENYPPAFLRDPLTDNAIVMRSKARTELLPPALAAAGLPGLPYTRYHEIAAVMLPEEIHPEVREKLDLIRRALGL